MATSIAILPLAYSGLGPERFGTWAALTSFFMLFGFLDGGLGNAVVNRIVDLKSKNNTVEIQKTITLCYALLFLVSSIGLLITIPTVFLIPDNWLVRQNSEIGVNDIRLMILIVGLAFFMSIPLSLAGKVRAGLQQGYVYSFFDIINSLCTLLIVFVAWAFSLHWLYFFVAVSIGSFFGSVLGTLHFLLTERNLRPSIRLFSWENSSLLTRDGMLFVGLQICSALAFCSDAVIVGYMCGAEATAEFHIVNRFFMLSTTIATLISTPLWPAFRDAFANGEFAWIRSTLRRSLIAVCAVGFTISIPMLLFNRQIFQVWIERDFDPPTILTVSAFLWANMLIVGQLLSMLLNGIGKIRFQLRLAVAMTVCNLPLSIYLTRILGAGGVFLGSFIAYGITVCVPAFYVISRYDLANTDRKLCKNM